MHKWEFLTLGDCPAEFESLFYSGNRLLAEVKALAARFHIADSVPTSFFVLLRRSFGISLSTYDQAPAKDESPIAKIYGNESRQLSDKDLVDLAKAYPSFPDPLLVLILRRRITYNIDKSQRIAILQRLALLCLFRFPKRIDLPCQVLLAEDAGCLLRSAPHRLLSPGAWYSDSQPLMSMLGALWAQSYYEGMWHGMASALMYGRHFPYTDFHIRALSIIGESSKALSLFSQLYKLHPEQFTIPSLSNILFMLMGMECLDQGMVLKVSKHFNSLSRKSLPSEAAHSPKVTSYISERPVLAILSADLRNHPVGRFWLPIARVLRRYFKVIYFAGHPLDDDPIRSEYKSLCEEWNPLTPHQLNQTSSKLREISPNILLDLGGHTADNHPMLLCQRYADVQATYLGFYGPTYSSNCDWWILDEALNNRVANSYPGSEKIWALPCSSLCYVPSLHGLPPVESIDYSTNLAPVLGSFNHTRKITALFIERVSRILKYNPEATLLFRSHAFQDPAVRRRLLQLFRDQSVYSHQLLPIPYAQSPSQAILDYRRVNLHIDSYPVSGTTTTLDSLSMGIPVLTCPNNLYAGAISAAILENAGLSDMICEDPNELPAKARILSERFQSPDARRELAYFVRRSPVCDGMAIPRVFVEQLGTMLRKANHTTDRSVDLTKMDQQSF